MSDIYTRMKQVVEKEVVTGKKCDVCGKMIQPTGRGYLMKDIIPFFDITTHHNDWGNDSVESYEHLHACSPECALKLAREYLNDDFYRIHTHTIEIVHNPGWLMPKEEAP